MENKSKFKVAILVFDDADLMDITGPKEVFSAVRKPRDGICDDEILKLYDSDPIFIVQYIGLHQNDLIKTGDGTKIIVDLDISEISNKEFDILVIPGGKGAQFVKSNEIVHKLIVKHVRKGQILLSVCTGAYIVAESGILSGKRITTHERHYELFEKKYTDHKLIRDVEFIQEGNIFITSGVISGIEGALGIINHLLSKEVALSASKTINYKPGIDKYNL